MQENEKAKAASVDPIVMRLESFRELTEGWDSYGALPIDDAAIDRAIRLAQQLFSSVPHVVPTVDGRVSFEGNDGTSIEIGASPSDDEIWSNGDVERFA